MDYKSPKPPLEALTGLRFLAALAVFNLHFLYLKNWYSDVPAPLLSVISAGDKGVTLFFMLSGFILAYAYSNIDSDKTSRIKFWINRFARIYPVYLLAWLWIAPSFLALRFSTEPAMEALQKSVAAGAPSLLLLQSWIHPRFAIAWNGPGWTLSVEAFFYLVFPFAAILIRKLSRTKLLLATSLFLTAYGILSYFSALIFGADSMLARYVHTHPLPNLLIFLAGVSLGYLFQGEKLNNGAARAITLTGTTLAFACAAISIDSLVGLFANHFLMLFAIALILYGVASNGGPAFLKSRLMITLGEASYSFYLLQFAISATVAWLAGYTLGPENYDVLFGTPSHYIALLVVTISISIIVYRKVESPMRIHLQKYLNKRFVEPPPQTRSVISKRS